MAQPCAAVGKMEVDDNYFFVHLRGLYKVFLLFGIFKYKYDFTTNAFRRSTLQTIYHWIVCSFAFGIVLWAVPTSGIGFLVYLLKHKNVESHSAQDIGLKSLGNTGKLLSDLLLACVYMRHQKLIIKMVHSSQRIYRAICELQHVVALNVRSYFYKTSFYVVCFTVFVECVSPAIGYMFNPTFPLLLQFMLFLLEMYEKVLPMALFLLQQLTCEMFLLFYDCLIEQLRNSVLHNERKKLKAIVTLLQALYQLRDLFDQLLIYINIYYLLRFIDDTYHFYMALKFAYYSINRARDCLIFLYVSMIGLKMSYVYLLLGMYSDLLRARELFAQHQLLMLHIRMLTNDPIVEGLFLYSKFKSASLSFTGFCTLSRSFVMFIFENIVIINALNFLQYFRSSYQHEDLLTTYNVRDKVFSEYSHKFILKN